jgi:hypothetical protein
MCSSRPVASGIFEVSAPCSWAEKGHKLYAVWAYEQSYTVAHSDGLERLVRPSGLSNGGHAWGVGLGIDEAKAELETYGRLGLVHESLSSLSLELPDASH